MLGQHSERLTIDVVRTGHLDHSVFTTIQHGSRDGNGRTIVLRCAHHQLVAPESGIQIEHCDAIGACSRLCEYFKVATICALQLDYYFCERHACGGVTSVYSDV
jgi:hypothetical protein